MSNGSQAVKLVFITAFNCEEVGNFLLNSGIAAVVCINNEMNKFDESA